MLNALSRGRLPLLLILSLSASAQTIPADTELQLRLRQIIASFGTRPGSPVEAVVIAPVVENGVTLIPLGSEVSGTVTAVRRVGLGFAREVAWVDIGFDQLKLPDGTVIQLQGQVSSLDNARETVDSRGRIQGIRATASLSSVISGIALSAAALDPMLLTFGLVSSLSVFRIPESEIILPAGTELRYRMGTPLRIDSMRGFGPALPVFAETGPEREALETVVRDLPFRTVTENTNIPSDLTNLAFVGSEDALMAAFDAAGWTRTDSRNTRSTYNTMRSIMENQGYREAPMSTLLLNGEAPRFTYAKTLNTFFKRHHLRLFPQQAKVQGQAVWTASSTHDSGIGFATAQKSFLHLIDQNIDEERQKVAYDLILTGCVTGVAMVERPWLPENVSNATGDHLRTDRRIAVLRLNECSHPRRADTPLTDNKPAAKPLATLRATRDTMLTLRNDLLRGNVGYQGYQGFRMSKEFFSKKTATKPRADQQLKEIDYGGQR